MRRILFVVIILSACRPSKFQTEQEFYAWWNDESNGFTKQYDANSFSLSAKYLPAEYLAFKELKSNPSFSFDSLVVEYNSGYTFLISIKSKNQKGDPLLKENDLEDFAGKIYDLNFIPEQFVQLTIGDSILVPVLSTLESGGEIGNQRTWYVVFSALDGTEHQYKDLDLLFDDHIYNSGLHHFIFNRTDIAILPAFEFVKNKS